MSIYLGGVYEVDTSGAELTITAMHSRLSEWLVDPNRVGNDFFIVVC